MQRAAIQRVLGLLLMVFSVTLLPPAVVSLIYADGSLAAFIGAFALVGVEVSLAKTKTLWRHFKQFIVFDEVD